MPNKFLDPTTDQSQAPRPTQAKFVDPGATEEVERQKADFGTGLIQMIAQGLTLGFSDEISAAAMAVPASLQTGEDISIVYNTLVGDIRGQQDQFREENPKTALAAEIGGGLLTGGAGGLKVAGSQALRNAPRLTKFAAAGAVPGSITGAGFSDSDSIPEAAKDVLVGGTTGAATGAALPIVGGFAAKGLQKGAVAIDTAFRGAPTRALRQVKQAFELDEVSAANALRKKQVLGEEASLGDIGGENVLGIAEDIAQQPGRGRNRAAKFLTDRLKQQRVRIVDAVKGKLSSQAGTLNEASEEILTRMKVESRPIYEQAMSVRINNTEPLQALITNPKVKPLIPKAIKLAQSDVDLPQSLKSGLDPDNPNMVVWDYVKKAIDDRSRKVGGNERRILTGIKNKLVSVLDNQNPSYKEARKVWSDSARQLDALEEGRSIFKDAKTDITDLKTRFKGMSDDQKELFRVGAGHEVLNIVRNADDTLKGVPAASLLKKIFGSPAKREALQTIFENPSDFRSFRRTLQAEQKFSDNANTVLANSATARRLAQKEAGGVDATLAAEVAEALKGRISAGLRAISRVAKGATDDTAVKKELSERVFTKDLTAIKQTLKEMDEAGSTLPKWAQSALRLEDRNLVKWVKVEQNRNRLIEFMSGGLSAQLAK